MAEAGSSEQGYLTGQLLVAMPGMADPRFAKAVVYICAHNAEGAMGLVVNKLVDSITFPDLLDQLEIEKAGHADEIRVHFGGPVETSRGFVLHSDDYLSESSMRVTGGMALTATLDILRDLAGGSGPRHSLLALGYAGWGPGQLDGELQDNGWLSVAPDDALVFDSDLENKWDRAIAKLGISPFQLSGDAGHA
ncbi:MAG: YqgE/AlgH family protein [Rhodovibrionaceae bacterium]|nr:YqgE/AlgH family protein [Rhodovibrionaceae bacterium]